LEHTGLTEAALAVERAVVDCLDAKECTPDVGGSLGARAAADARSIITFDLDFGDILALGVLDRPSVVILRVSDERPDSVNARLASVLSECREALESGALVLVEDERYRVRRLPIG